MSKSSSVNTDATWIAALRSDQDVRDVSVGIAAIVGAFGRDVEELRHSASDACRNAAMTREGLRAINESTISTSDRMVAFLKLARTITTLDAVKSSASTVRLQVLAATTALASFMETTCRSTLGDTDRSDALAEEIDTLTAMESNDLMRLLIFRIVAECAASRTTWQCHNPEWCKRRDRAFANLARDLEILRQVALDSPWSQGDRTAGIARTDAWLRGVTEQLNSIQTPTVERDGRLVLNPLAASRRDLGAPESSAQGGRPKETWRTEAIAKLREIGVTKEHAEGLLDAAGLTAPYPGRQS